MDTDRLPTDPEILDPEAHGDDLQGVCETCGAIVPLYFVAGVAFGGCPKCGEEIQR